MSDWRPIATAPRDGTNILLLFPDSVPDVPYMRVGSFCTEAQLDECGGFPWADGGWLMFDMDGHSFDDCPADKPLFWQPLMPGPHE